MIKIGIIGKTNVGKSTLFNRLIGQQKSIISAIAGTTRDHVSGSFLLGGEEVELTDFGGFDFSTNLEIEKGVQSKIMMNIKKMDILFFVVDGRVGISTEDERIAEIVRKSKKKCILVVNKIDNEKKKDLVFDFYKLGFENVVAISAINNINFDGLLAITAKTLGLKKSIRKIIDKDLTRIAIIGKPNVGKSSLFNIFCGEERSIVTEMAGTTRDAIDAEVELDGKKFVFVDTAGMRRKTKISDSLDKESSHRSIKAINRSDIVIYLLDVNSFATEYDIKLLGYAWKKGKVVILVINKWDIKPPDMTELKYKNILINDYSIFKNFNFVFVSAVKSKGIDNLIEEIKRVDGMLGFKIKTSLLNQEVRKVLSEFGKTRGRFFYAVQVGQNPIEILLFVNNKKDFNKPYIDYLEKGLRKNLNLAGFPIKIITREK